MWQTEYYAERLVWYLRWPAHDVTRHFITDGLERLQLPLSLRDVPFLTRAAAAAGQMGDEELARRCRALLPDPIPV